MLEDLQNEMYKDTYTLKKRMTCKQLMGEYAAAVAEAEVTYMATLLSAKTNLVENAQQCMYMDTIFNKEYCEHQPNDNNEEIITSKDGSRHLTCPECYTKTFKLKRHMEKHSNLSLQEKKYAIYIAGKIATNKKPEQLNIQTSKINIQRSKPNRHQNTHLVSRKHNYKRCIICQKLVLNISEHVSQVHKISRDNSRYEYYVKETSVVPKVFTKIVDKQVQELTGSDLDEAEKLHSETFQQQTELYENLKEKRIIVENLKEKLNRAKSEGRYTAIRDELKEAENIYKSLRYKDKRQYTENVLAWKESFVEYLEQIGHHDSEKGARMAIDVIINYEKTSDVSLTIDDITDGKKLRNVLKPFTNMDSITSTSKLKYLKMFQMLTNFLVNDVTSPERKQTDSVQQILARGLKLKEIEHEINMVHAVLSKDKGKDMVRTRQKAKDKLMEMDEITELTTQQTAMLSEFLAKDTPSTTYSITTAIAVRIPYYFCSNN